MRTTEKIRQGMRGNRANQAGPLALPTERPEGLPETGRDGLCEAAAGFAASRVRGAAETSALMTDAAGRVIGASRCALLWINGERYGGEDRDG